MGQVRYFKRASNGAFYRGTRSTGDVFTDDGRTDADAIAQACAIAPTSDVIPITLADSDPDPRSGTLFAEPDPPPPSALDADGQRLWDYMPVSGTATAQAVSAFIADTTKDPALRATMATLRSAIRKLWQERKT